ncbi:MAG: hypothetical protein JHD24_01280 [Polynucleobacter sp.]|jgi:hypothetical protein|nr:hypothetical protein [Polynucleobacter sp.]
MRKLDEQFFLAEELLRITAKEVHYLERTRNRLISHQINLEWVNSLANSDAHSDILEAFVARFGRLQDRLGGKLLPTLLRLNMEKVGSQLDNLILAEKLGWLSSTDDWIELRGLRNLLIHEYLQSPSDLLKPLLQALEAVSLLGQVHLRLNQAFVAIQAKAPITVPAS